MGYDPKQPDDGVFFMFWEDVVANFNLLDICRIKDNANYVFEDSIYKSGQPKFYEITYDGKDPLTLSVCQENPRAKVTSNGQPATSALVSVFFSKLNEDSHSLKYEYVNSDCDNQYFDFNMELKNLEAGKYVVMVELDGDKAAQPATLTLYSPANISFKEVKGINSVDFCHRFMLDHAIKNEGKNYLTEDQEDWFCTDILTLQCRLGYVAIKC